MYVRRPMCLLSILFALAVYLVIELFPPQYAIDLYPQLDGMQICVEGRVVQKEEKNGTFRFYLSDITFPNTWNTREVLETLDSSADDASSLDSSMIIHSNRNTYNDSNIVRNSYKGFTGLIAYTPNPEAEYNGIFLGSTVRLSGRVALYTREENEGQFNSAMYYYIRGYSGSLFTPEIMAVSASHNELRECLYQAKVYLGNVILQYLNEKETGVMKAIMFGDKVSLDADLKRQYQYAGISHVLCQSGLHIAGVGLFVMALLRRLGIRLVPASILSAALIGFYGFFSGFSTSVVRAFIMFSLSVLAQAINRTYDLLSAAAVSSMMILLENPYYIYDSGFLLSFGAVLGIGLVLPCFSPIEKAIIIHFRKREYYIQEKKLPRMRRIWQVERTMISSFLAGISVLLFTLPISAYSFFGISILSTFLNLAVVPLLSVLLAAGFMGIALALLETGIIAPLMGLSANQGLLARLIFKIAHVILEIYDKLSSLSIAIPKSFVHIGRPGMIPCTCYYIVLAIGIYVCEKKKSQKPIDRTSRDFLKNNTSAREKKRYCYLKNTNFAVVAEKVANSIKSAKAIHVFLFAISVAICILCIRRVSWMEIRNISVGQGDSTLIFGNHAPVILLDAGSSSEKNVGTYRVAPVILSNGIGRIDYLFLTHEDADHVNGVSDLLLLPESVLQIGCVVTTADCWQSDELQDIRCQLMEKNIPICLIGATDVMEAGDLRIECLSPSRENKVNAESRADMSSLHAGKNVGRGTGIADLPPHDANRDSLVLKITHVPTGFCSLFMGDATVESEERIMQLADEGCVTLPKVNYIKVGHHGSSGSGKAEFINKISPDIACISCGLNNRYGHPHKETLDRLSDVGARVYRTDECGQVTVKVDKGEIQINRFIKVN